MNFYYAISFVFLVDPGLSSKSLRGLLKAFEDIETDLKYITVFNVDYKETINDFMDILDSPKIVLDIKEGVNDLNFLNHRTVKDIKSLKFLFGRRCMSTVFFGNATEESVLIVVQFLKLSFMQRTILIFDDEEFIEMSVSLFKKFQNLIIINMKSFTKCKCFSDNKGNVHAFNGNVPPKAVFTDISGEKVIVNGFQYAPYCMVYYNEISKRYEFYGLVSHILENFINYINGTANFIPAKELYKRNITEAQPEIGANFSTFVQFLPGLQYSLNMRISQLRSYPYDHFQVFLVFNSPHQIARDSYAFRPLNPSVWILNMIFIIYASALYTVSLKLAKIDKSFWSSFSIVFRSLLAQSFEPDKTLVCVIAVVYGFMLTTAFSAFLGSYLTLLIFEEPLEGWSDIVKRNMTVFISDTYNVDEIRSNVPELDIYKEHITYVPPRTKHEMIYDGNIDSNTAFVENSGHWKYMMVPQMEFYDTRIYRTSKYSFGRSFMFIYHEYSLKYKYRLNRFLGLIKDSGLYNFWCNQAFYENLKYRFYPHLKITRPTAVDTLTLKYFRKVFQVWSFGLFFASLAFCLEWISIFVSGFCIEWIFWIKV